MTYWPAWIVAPVLAALAVGYWVTLRLPLGVSGVLARFTRVREELAVDASLAALHAERAALVAARAAERARGAALPDAAACGAEPGRTLTARWQALPPDLVEEPGARICAPTPPVSVHATFLVSLAAGGLLASLARGSFGAGRWIGAEALGFGAPSILVLAAGGVLVGFGASLCGGCPARHGLTGSGRLMPGSLVATAVFFGAAVVTSLLLRGLG